MELVQYLRIVNRARFMLRHEIILFHSRRLQHAQSVAVACHQDLPSRPIPLITIVRVTFHLHGEIGVDEKTFINARCCRLIHNCWNIY